MRRMQFRLDIPRGTRQRYFLDYLNAAVCERPGSYAGDARTDQQGNFISTLTGPFLGGPTSVIQLRWELTIDSAGTLQTIDVHCVDPAAQHAWEAPVTALVTSVLAAA